jgi:phospho-N-acetylmuramoyl-pentapeptide-transferase
MLYYIFTYLEKNFDITGAGLFNFITFRASMAALLSLIISMIIGRGIIKRLRVMQIGESVRDLGLQGQMEKKGTPTMGGVIIIAAIIIPILLFAKLDNVYVLLSLASVTWMGVIGFIDDYIKVFKKDKEGLQGRFKIIAQVVLGLVVALTLYSHPDVRIRDFNHVYTYNIQNGEVDWRNPVNEASTSIKLYDSTGIRMDDKFVSHDSKSLATNIPFLKDNLLDYAKILSPITNKYEKWAWLIFIPIVIFIITAVSNASNLTDGIDGLATGTSAVILLTLGIFAYVSGNYIFSDYLNILYIPDSGEMVIVCAAAVGACIGFLWYNTFPAQVFMGDTGSLMLGGLIATIAIIVRKELLIPILCGIFFAENLSVILQVAYFKYTKKKYGEGRRIFLMSPLHHHFQKLGYHEAKIVMRFIIIGILLAILSILTLKIR